MDRLILLSLKFIVLLIGLSVLLLSVYWLPWIADTMARENPEYAYLKLQTAAYIRWAHHKMLIVRDDL